MDVEEYMNEILDLTINVDFTEEELDLLDLTIRSIIVQMDWGKKVGLVSDVF